MLLERLHLGVPRGVAPVLEVTPAHAHLHGHSATAATHLHGYSRHSAPKVSRDIGHRCRCRRAYVLLAVAHDLIGHLLAGGLCKEIGKLPEWQLVEGHAFVWSGCALAAAAGNLVDCDGRLPHRDEHAHERRLGQRPVSSLLPMGL